MAALMGKRFEGIGKRLWESDGPEDKRESLRKMFSEFFREAAVLILVFGLLDKFTKSKSEDAASIGYWVTIAALGLSCLAIGIYLERWDN